MFQYSQKDGILETIPLQVWANAFYNILYPYETYFELYDTEYIF